MTGLLCITALTNEHSDKGELKDQRMCGRVRADGRVHWGKLATGNEGKGGGDGGRVRGGVHLSEISAVRDNGGSS